MPLLKLIRAIIGQAYRWKHLFDFTYGLRQHFNHFLLISTVSKIPCDEDLTMLLWSEIRTVYFFHLIQSIIINKDRLMNMISIQKTNLWHFFNFWSNYSSSGHFQRYKYVHHNKCNVSCFTNRFNSLMSCWKVVPINVLFHGISRWYILAVRVKGHPG